jgi:hypothetical protein
MLSEFLSHDREMILELSRRKVIAGAGSAPDPDAWNQGLPEVYDHLISSLEYIAKYGARSAGESDEAAAAKRGEKMLRLGLTVSQVVHGYGAICQAITEAAQEKGFPISPDEFNVINRVLDIAIAEAVTAYEGLHNGLVREEESRRLGALAHDLRNALTNVTLSHLMIKSGTIGISGETNAVLERGLRRMADIIDRSLEEVRLQSEPRPVPVRLRLIDLVDEVWVTASAEAKRRGIKLLVQVAPAIALEADSQHLVSALSNIVQNAIKFTKPGTTVRLRAQEAGDQVVIEVEDGCGGLPPGRIEELFQPFKQSDADRSGVGLGLSLSRHAVEANGGLLTARDLPGRGCVFSITLPKEAVKAPPVPAVAAVAS